MPLRTVSVTGLAFAEASALLLQPILLGSLPNEFILPRRLEVPDLRPVARLLLLFLLSAHLRPLRRRRIGAIR
jgi:hypothetical protein